MTIKKGWFSTEVQITIEELERLYGLPLGINGKFVTFIEKFLKIK